MISIKLIFDRRFKQSSDCIIKLSAACEKHYAVHIPYDVSGAHELGWFVSPLSLNPCIRERLMSNIFLPVSNLIEDVEAVPYYMTISSSFSISFSYLAFRLWLNKSRYKDIQD